MNLEHTEIEDASSDEVHQEHSSPKNLIPISGLPYPFSIPSAWRPEDRED